MCLVLLSFQAHPDTPLLLAGNRDEFYARPSAPPALIGTDPRIYAGRDLEAGGTWIGRNEHGLVAVLTNRRTREVPAQARSRGEIVRGLLEQPTVEAAAHWMAAREVGRYRPFNVLFGSPRRCFYVASVEGPAPRELAPGRYALSNSDLDDASWPKVARSQRFLARAALLDGEALLLALQAFLCDPTPPDDLPPGGPGEEVHGALGAVFIRTPDYGTVSSSILVGGGALGERYYFAEAEAMRAAQRGWARAAFGDGTALNSGTALVPPHAAGSPFRLLRFDD